MKAFISDFDGTIFFPEREEKISRNDVYAIKVSIPMVESHFVQ